MKVNVKVNIDPNLMKARAKKADLALTLKAAADTNKFVPFLTGSLSNRAQASDSDDDKHLADEAIKATEDAVKAGRSTIIYPGPYAHYLYVGKLLLDPVTGSSWVKYGGKKTKVGRDLVFSKSGHKDAQAKWFEASKAMNMDKWLRVYRKALDSGN